MSNVAVLVSLCVASILNRGAAPQIGGADSSATAYSALLGSSRRATLMRVDSLTSRDSWTPDGRRLRSARAVGSVHGKLRLIFALTGRQGGASRLLGTTLWIGAPSRAGLGFAKDSSLQNDTASAVLATFVATKVPRTTRTGNIRLGLADSPWYEEAALIRTGAGSRMHIVRGNGCRLIYRGRADILRTPHIQPATFSELGKETGVSLIAAAVDGVPRYQVECEASRRGRLVPPIRGSFLRMDTATRNDITFPGRLDTYDKFILRIRPVLQAQFKKVHLTPS